MTLFCSVLAIAIPFSQLGCIMVDDSLFMVRRLYLTSLQYLQDICHATHRMILNFKTSLASTRFFSHYYWSNQWLARAKRICQFFRDLFLMDASEMNNIACFIVRPACKRFCSSICGFNIRIRYNMPHRLFNKDFDQWIP